MAKLSVDSFQGFNFSATPKSLGDNKDEQALRESINRLESKIRRHSGSQVLMTRLEDDPNFNAQIGYEEELPKRGSKNKLIREPEEQTIMKSPDDSPPSESLSLDDIEEQGEESPKEESETPPYPPLEEELPPLEVESPPSSAKISSGLTPERHPRRQTVDKPKASPSFFGLLPSLSKSSSLHKRSNNLGDMTDIELVNELYQRVGVKGNPLGLLRALNAQRIRSATSARQSKRAKIKQVGRRNANLRNLGQILRQRGSKANTPVNQDPSVLSDKSLGRRPRSGRPKMALGYGGHGVYRTSRKGLQFSSSSSYRNPRVKYRKRNKRSLLIGRDEKSSSLLWLSSLLSETDKNLDEIDSEIDKSFKTLFTGGLSKEKKLVELRGLVEEVDTTNIDTSSRNQEAEFFEDSFSIVDENPKKVYTDQRNKDVVCGAVETLVDDRLKMVSKRYKRRIGKGERMRSCFDSSLDNFPDIQRKTIQAFEDDEYNKKKKVILDIMKEVSMQSETKLPGKLYDNQGLMEVLSKIERSKSDFSVQTVYEELKPTTSEKKDDKFVTANFETTEERELTPFAQIWKDELGKISKEKNECKEDVKSEEEYPHSQENFNKIKDHESVSYTTPEHFAEYFDFPSLNDNKLPVVSKTASSTIEYSNNFPAAEDSKELTQLLTDQVNEFAHSSLLKYSECRDLSRKPTEEVSYTSKCHSVLQPSMMAESKSYPLPSDLVSSNMLSITPKISQSFLESACDEMKKRLGGVELRKSKTNVNEETSNLQDVSTDFDSIDTNNISTSNDSFLSACLGDFQHENFYVMRSVSYLYKTPPHSSTPDYSQVKQHHLDQKSCLTITSTPSSVKKNDNLLLEYDTTSIHKICILDEESSDSMRSCHSGIQNRQNVGGQYALPFENSLNSIQSFDTFESHFTHDCKSDEEVTNNSCERVKTNKTRKRESGASLDAKNYSSTANDVMRPKYYPTRVSIPLVGGQNKTTSRDVPNEASTSDRDSVRVIVGRQSKKTDDLSARYFYRDNNTSSESESSPSREENNLLPPASVLDSITKRDYYYQNDIPDDELLVTCRSTSLTKAFEYCETEKNSQSSRNSNWTRFSESLPGNEYLTPLPPVPETSAAGFSTNTKTSLCVFIASAPTTAAKRTVPQRRDTTIAFVPVPLESSEDEEPGWKKGVDATWSPLSLGHSSSHSSKESNSIADVTANTRTSEEPNGNNLIIENEFASNGSNAGNESVPDFSD